MEVQPKNEKQGLTNHELIVRLDKSLCNLWDIFRSEKGIITEDEYYTFKKEVGIRKTELLDNIKRGIN